MKKTKILIKMKKTKKNKKADTALLLLMVNSDEEKAETNKIKKGASKNNISNKNSFKKNNIIHLKKEIKSMYITKLLFSFLFSDKIL